MKHLLLALLLVSVTSALADSPAKIAEDYRKAAALAVERLDLALEKAATPLISKLVQQGDTAGAELLTAQLKAKLEGEPVPTPHAAATLLFAQYDQARTKALEPVQKSSIARIDSMLKSVSAPKLETVTELAKVRAEIELNKLTQPATTMPQVWTYHVTEKPDGSVGVVYGEMHFMPDGTMKMLDRGPGKKTSLGRWKTNKKGDKVTINVEGFEGEWLMEIKGSTATLDRDVGRRYMRVQAPPDK